MEINLLPRRSPYEEYRFLIIALPILLLIACGTYGLVQYWQMNSNLALLQNDLYHIKSDNIVLRAEHRSDSKTKLFNDIQTAVQEVQQKQHHNGVMLDAIAANLPEKMRVTSATMDLDKKQITLELQSDSVDHIAEYAALLRKEPWVQDVFVQNINNTVDDSADQQALSQKVKEFGLQEMNPQAATGKQLTQDFAAKVKQQIPFTTKLEITLAETKK